VVLSFGLPFALVPLAIFTTRKDLMGGLTNRPWTTVLVSLASLVVIALNVYLLVQVFTGG
jgi:manganese transport protein